MDTRCDTQAIDVILKSVMGGAKERGQAITDIQNRWSKIVGGQLAKHSKPVSLRRGLLVVNVDRPGDNYTLSLRKQELLEQLQEVAEEAVRELVIRPGTINAKQVRRKIKRSIK